MPVRVYPARTLRIQAMDTVLVDLNLGYGSHVHRTLKIEGMSRNMVGPQQHDTAFGCLTRLIGGKKLLVETEDFRTEGTFLARVFLDDGPVYFDPPGLSHPHGFEEKRLEISGFFRHLVVEGLDLHTLNAFLNGKVHPTIESKFRT